MVKNYFADAQWHTVKQNTCICLRHLIGTRPRLTTKLWNRNNTSRYAVQCGLWVKCGTAEGKMRNGNCGTMVIGPQVRPRDRSYYAVYSTPHVAEAAVNCIMRVWKVAFYACYHNLNLPFAAKCV